MNRLLLGLTVLICTAGPVAAQSFPVKTNASGVLAEPSTFFSSNAAAINALGTSVYQPLDVDLTAIASLTTTSYGRSTLSLADAAAGRAYFGVVIGTNVQAWDSDLDSIAALTTTSFGRSTLALADAAAGRSAFGLGASDSPSFSRLITVYGGFENNGDGGVSTGTPIGWADGELIPRFRLTRSPTPNPISGFNPPQHFLITPYEFGMSFEYNGLVEWWVDEFSIHNDPALGGPAKLWVGNDNDTGGLFFTALNQSEGTVKYGEITSKLFDDSSGGPLNFKVINYTDAFHFKTAESSAGVFAMSILGTGRVGLGTANVGVDPDTWLHIRRAPDTLNGMIKLQPQLGGDYAGLTFWCRPPTSSPHVDTRNWQISNNYYDGGNLDFMRSDTNTGNPTVRVMSLTRSNHLSLAGGIVGVATVSNAAAGNLGEYVSSTVASGSAVALTTATAANVTSISLTAGDWDVTANVNFAWNTATVTGASAGIHTTTATLPTDGTEAYSSARLTTASGNDTITLARKRINVSTTTTVYLVASGTFGAGSGGAFGSISARRVR